MTTHAERHYLELFFTILGAALCLVFLIGVPYGWFWLFQSGESRMEKAVEAQVTTAARIAEATDDLAPESMLVLYGPALPTKHADYALALYNAVKPVVVVLGSHRVSGVRASYAKPSFVNSFVNMGGSVRSVEELQHVLKAMLSVHAPKIILVGVDFWWFDHNAPAPAAHAPLSLWERVTQPWLWFFSGVLTPKDFFAPVTGAFKDTLFGFMAQKNRTGFGADGSYFATHILSGHSAPPDFRFQQSLAVAQKSTYGNVGEKKLDILTEIYFHTRARGVDMIFFMPPMAPPVFAAFQAKKSPLFNTLAQSIAQRGIPIIDLSNPASVESPQCEFLDGFTGADVLGARVLYRLADHFPNVLPFVNTALIQEALKERRGYAGMINPYSGTFEEVDFMQFSCPRR